MGATFVCLLSLRKKNLKMLNWVLGVILIVAAVALVLVLLSDR